MELSWQNFEEQVRAVASLKWRCMARAEHLGGIDFDAVLRPTPDETILIEISKNETLDKVRTDIAKIVAYRSSLFPNNIVCRAYIVFENAPTKSMIETGMINHVNVLSFEQFQSLLFDYKNYVAWRRLSPFGSVINPFSGKKDESKYVPVKYICKDKEINVEEIVSLLQNKHKIVLIGDYGTGKSRCVEKIFDSIVENKKTAVAINLREHWGATTSSAIIAGHLDALGFRDGFDNAMQLLKSGGIILLLDGVDEVGASVFGTVGENRKNIRKQALVGVSKLVGDCPAGVFLTTRAHYFDRDEEIIESLGLPNNSQTVIIRCKDTFTQEEAAEYMRNNNFSFDIPEWLPYKPLVFQVFAEIADNLAKNNAAENDYLIWSYFFSAICEREAKIHGSIDAETVKRILIRLGVLSRTQISPNGSFSIQQLREAYEEVTKISPDEAGDHMLMRLCCLGRISQESTERQFVDNYIADGLRAEAMIVAVTEHNLGQTGCWKQSLKPFGMDLLADYMNLQDCEKLFIIAFFSFLSCNFQAAIELLAVLADQEGECLDCKNYVLTDCEISNLTLGKREIMHLEIRSSVIANLEILHESSEKIHDVRIADCLIDVVSGISAAQGEPSWLEKCEITYYHKLSNITKIKSCSLPRACVILLSVIHRVFFQKGAARKEASLYKSGFGQDYDKHLTKEILRILIKEGVVKTAKGNEGIIYKPERAYTARMRLMNEQLVLSKDPIWLAVSKLGKEKSAECRKSKKACE